MRAKPHVLGPHRDLDRFTRLDVGRHQRREAMPSGVDDAELAVALEHAAREQARRTGEIRHEQVGRTIVDLVRGRHLQQLAVAHDANAVAEHHGLGLVVGDVDRGDPGLLDDAPQVVAQPQPQLRVEIAQRLVEEEELRLIDKAARQRHALHLPARERHHRALRELRQPDQRQHVADLALDLGARDATVAERISHVLLDRHMRPDRVGLEHHADVAQPRRHLHAVGGRRYQPPADADAAGRGMFEAGDAPQRGGLAAAGGAEQHHDLAGRHVKAHAVHRRPAGDELLAQIANVERRRHACAPSYRRPRAETPVTSLAIVVGPVPVLDPGSRAAPGTA